MSFGQNFAYSKTREEDVALMLAANVSFTRFDNSYSATLEPRIAQN